MGAPEAFSGRSTTVPSVRKRLGKAVLCLLSLVLVLAPLAPAYAVDEALRNGFPSVANLESTPLNTSACKLPYAYGEMNSLGFPMTPNRLPNTGTHRELIIAVDFPDAPFKGDAKAFLERFTNPIVVSDFYDFNSYGKVKVEFDVYPEIVRLPEASASYGGDKYKVVLKNNTWSNDLIHKAAISVLDQKIDLSKYSALATIVTGGETLSLAGGYASPVSPGFFRFKNGSFNHASLLGAGWVAESADPEATELSWRVLAHEIGHLFGFIDIYMYNGETYKQTTPGPFDLMGFAASWAPTLSAWNRWLMNWVTDSQVICMDIKSPDIQREITSLNTPNGLKAVVIRISNTKLLVIESRKNNKFDTLSGNEGLLVYSVDLAIKSGEGSVRIVPELNEMTALPEDKALGDIPRFLTGTLKAGEYVSYQGLLIENIASFSTGDTIRISSNAEAIKNRAAADAEAKKLADQTETLIASAKENGTFFTSQMCARVGTLATFQILESGTWKDVSISQGWIKSPSCTQKEFYLLYLPWIIKELPSSTKYRWKYNEYNASFSYFTPELVSPLTAADIRAQAEALEKAKANRTYYQDNSCHAYGTNATFQAFLDGEWRDIKAADSWIENSGCPQGTPRQPWVIAELPSKTQYRWKVTAKGWISDWYSNVLLSPITLADEKAAQEAERLAAEAKAKADKEAERLAAIAQTKANEEARAKAAALAASKKITITCIKGKTVKKVSAVNPKCPAGFKKK